MPYPLPLTRTEAYLAYKAGVIQQSDLKPSLAVPRNGIDAWLAYWTGLAADYPKREDGTPHILQEEEAYIAYLCGVINEYPEKCLRRVGAYLRYLISARWGRPDRPLNREELYLSLIKTQFIPSGDPSSDIVIDGTAKAPFVDVKMYGDTFQQTYEGKNILDYITGLIASGGGLTNTINNDGTITTVGTPNDDYNRIIEYYDLTPYLEDGATYTLSSTLYDNKTFAQVRRVKISDSSAYNYDTLVRAKTFTVDKSQYTYRMGIMANTMAAWGDESLTITKGYQLEKSATATSYEPYVGGVPSPNPDYPQPIQTVTGEQTVTVSGKNLFDPAIVVHPSGMPNNLGETLRVDTNTTYTFNVGNDRNFAQVQLFDNTGTRTRTLGNGINDHLLTFTTTASEVSGLFCFYPGQSGVDPTTYDYTGVQLEKSSTATTYAPYNATNYPISLGSIELCKLGTYQDYIYKDGDDWKIRKRVLSIIMDGNTSITPNRFGTNSYAITVTQQVVWPTTQLSAVSKYFYGIKHDDRTQEIPNSTFIAQALGQDKVIILRNTGFTTPEALSSWFDTYRPKFYCTATSTDTTITDSNLIAQLEALVKGGSEEGTTYIKVSATDPNLPAKLYVEAPKYA